MDESKLSKSDANRKPREFWLYDVFTQDHGEILVAFVHHKNIKGSIHVREVLQQDDSLRVSRKEWHNIKKLFLEFDTTEKFLRAADVVERIERASRSEV